jgi:hypothetical protein
LGYLYFGFIVVMVAIGVYYQQRRIQPREITIDETPSIVRDEVLRRVPKMLVERVLRKPDSFKLEGQVAGHSIQVKVQLRGNGAGQWIRKTEVQFETRSLYRSLKGKRLIDLADVPKQIMQRAQQTAEAYVGPMERIIRVKRGQVQGRTAFDIKGRVGNWQVEVEMLDDGEVLEVELKKKQN